jgi:hypothetical protein
VLVQQVLLVLLVQQVLLVLVQQVLLVLLVQQVLLVLVQQVLLVLLVQQVLLVLVQLVLLVLVQLVLWVLPVLVPVPSEHMQTTHGCYLIYLVNHQQLYLEIQCVLQTQFIFLGLFLLKEGCLGV